MIVIAVFTAVIDIISIMTMNVVGSIIDIIVAISSLLLTVFMLSYVVAAIIIITIIIIIVIMALMVADRKMLELGFCLSRT